MARNKARKWWTFGFLVALAVGAYAASDRSVDLQSSLPPIVSDLNEELTELFIVSSRPLDSVAGINDITASVANEPALASLEHGMKFTFKPVATNTGPVDLQIDATTEKDLLLPGGTQLAAGELLSGALYHVQYLGSPDDHYRLLSTPGGAAAGAIAVNIQTFTASGTYTPTAGIEHALVKCTGGGGGGGGADTNGSNTVVGVGGGGAAGGTAIEEYSSATLGASQSITIGLGGTGGSNTGGNGTAGGNTTFGTFMTATGGGAGLGSGTSTQFTSNSEGGAGGVPTGGDANIPGGNGGDGVAAGIDDNQNNIIMGTSGAGGVSYWGGGAASVTEANDNSATDLSVAGDAGTAPGTGGSGALDLTSTTGSVGGNGKDGICVIYEFI